MTWDNQVINLIILTEQTTGFSGLFGYSPTVGNGNLIFSIAAAAGTDPYGNAYPQGLSITLGVIAGATISGSSFQGTDYVINSSGAFFYSGTPAAGNLVNSVANSSGTDPYGNQYLQGVAAYGGSGVDWFASTLYGGVIASWFATSESAGWSSTGQIDFPSTGYIDMQYSGISGVLSVPQSAPTITTVPHNPNDPSYGGSGGASWISGERAVLDGQIDDINTNFTNLVNALISAGVFT
jgi:hypothetical protein